MTPYWEAVERPDGTSYEIRGARPEDGGAPASLGVAHITEVGWVAKAANGRSYGPFTSLSEAAYPLALAGEGHDARVLLGEPLPPGGVRHPVARVAPPAPPVRRNRDRLLGVALLVVAVAAIVADRRAPQR